MQVLINLYRSFRHQPVLAEFDHEREVWLIRILIQNGLALYAAWCTVLTLMNLAMCISYDDDLAQDKSSTIALAFLAAEILVWFGVDNFVLDKFVRYTVTPYVAVIWVLAGITDFHYAPDKRNSIFTAVLLALTMAALVVKLILMMWRHTNQSLHTVRLGEIAVHHGYDVKKARNTSGLSEEVYDKPLHYQYI